MRVAFFDTDADELTNYRKGKLFESLTRRLVEASGFTDVALRQLHNSLEYDIEGRLALQGTKLVGEAKAVERNMDGKTLAAFVGKLLPLAMTERVDGLFISVSPLTPDAGDYMSSLAAALERANLTLTTLVGDEIPTFLRDRAGHVSEEVLRRRVEERFGLTATDVWLVVSERDEFFCVLGGPNVVETPTSFALFKTDGEQLHLPGSLDRLRRQLPDLAQLSLVEAGQAPQLPLRAERLPSVDQGAGWFDYRFPAPPDCFIGRDTALREIQEALGAIAQGQTALRTVQILSRSGIGKSSLLLKLAAVLPEASVTTVDARSLRAPSDVRLIVSALAESVNDTLGTALSPPRSRDEADAALGGLTRRSREG